MIHMTEKINSDVNSSAKPAKSTPKKPRQKVVTVDSLLKQASKIDDYSIHVVNKETNEVIKYNEVFSETKIEQLIQELAKHVQYDAEHSIGFFTNYQMLVTYINFLIIKHFTNLNTILSDSLEENIVTIEQLRKLNYFKMLFDEVFDNEQVIHVHKSVDKAFEDAIRLSSLKEKQLEELSEVLKTPLLKERAKAQLEEFKNQNIN